MKHAAVRLGMPCANAARCYTPHTLEYRANVLDKLHTAETDTAIRATPEAATIAELYRSACAGRAGRTSEVVVTHWWETAADAKVTQAVTGVETIKDACFPYSSERLSHS